MVSKSELEGSVAAEPRWKVPIKVVTAPSRGGTVDIGTVGKGCEEVLLPAWEVSGWERYYGS